MLLAAPSFVGGGEEVCAQVSQAVPRLVVGIAIDQLRTDYLETFAPLYGEDGLKRLMREGVVYTSAQYASAGVDRASAVASLYTGTVPYSHGIVGEDWMDRQTLRPVHCVDDFKQRGVNTQETTSPQHLLVSTLGDELKVATDGRALVYSVAPSREAAVLSAGHAADYALWMNRKSGEWAGTSYYGQAPAATRLMMNTGTGNVNEWVSRTATTLIQYASMGADETPDLLTLCYDASVSEGYSTRTGQSVELEQVYVRLDAAIAQLLSEINKRIGLDKTLFFITSTGYEPSEPSALDTYRIPTGTLQINRCAALLNMYLTAIYGNGQYVESYYGNQLYLNHKLIEQKQLNLTEVFKTCEDFLFQYSGVRDVYTSTRLTQGAWTPGISRIRNAYHPKCSGDILIQVNPGWSLVNEDMAQSRFVRDSYFEFPLIFFGYGLKAEKVQTPITMDVVAPTVAHYMRIRAPNACSTAPLSF